ncbi:MAG: hypothetical protein JSV30_07180 [Candidatus Omnitrophota bacterium]|nr:MAG: hypothetical protein JSV30_07180 [Candidatus Omnitrophota bacterium]
MILRDYLKLLEKYIDNPQQNAWYERLMERVEKGYSIFQGLDEVRRKRFLRQFNNRIRTEELKAWYSSPEGEVLFQGTSISSLIVPCELSDPLFLKGIEDLEDAVAENYIRLHDRYADQVKNAIIENVDTWIKEGLYYGIVLSSKIVSQAFQLKVPYKDVVFKVRDFLVDPHEITSYPLDVRREYFQKAKEKIDCFKNVDLSREEVEASLVLADISKPRLEQFKDNVILAPVRCNEIATIFANRVKELIIAKTSGRIQPKSLTVVIFDTDTPYIYHHLLECNGNSLAPILPGLTLMGASGTIDAFRWLYAYRVSLVGQKIMKSSLYSEVHRKFIPFVYFGVLVPRDAEILLESENLSRLRYRGGIDPALEFCYLIPTINEYLETERQVDIYKKLKLKAK